jgi:REP element-mobilizing transposase RayT
MIGQTISHRIIVSKKPIIKKRKPLRLKEYNYSLEGSYFVTICTKDREDLFGQIVCGALSLNKYGKIVQSCWNELPNHYSNILLDEFVIMPNHVHGIIIIIDDVVGAGLRPAPTRDKRYPLSEIIRAFKSFSGRRINEMRRTPGLSVWQRNYYDHIIRNEKSLYRIREYVRTNPERWTWDKENPMFQGTDEFECWLNEEGKQKINSRRIL